VTKVNQAQLFAAVGYGVGAALAVLAVLHTGCGGGSSGPPPTVRQAATPTPTPTCVPFPPLTPTFTFTIEPSTPQVGDHVSLSVQISGGAPDGVYTLVATGNVVDVTGPTYVGTQGSEVRFELNALQPGTTDLVLKVFYTIDLPSPAYCYDSRYQNVQSGPFALTVTAAAG
jgi:hypothetical protein